MTGTSRAVGSHPKMRARREAVERAGGRRRVRLAIVVLALFSVLGAGWLVVNSGLLEVDEIQVRGTRHTAPEDVRRATGVQVGEPLLLVNRGRVTRSVEALPWVHEAEVSLSLPSRLVVTVNEREAVAWVTIGSTDDPDAPRVALIDAEGRVLEHRARRPSHLVELRIEVDVPAPGAMLGDTDGAVSVVAEVPAVLVSRVRAVVATESGFEIEMDGIERVRFGPATEIVRKWAALEAVVVELGDRVVELVDVRVPSVPAVREHRPEREEPPRSDDPAVGDDSDEPGAGDAPSDPADEDAAAG